MTQPGFEWNDIYSGDASDYVAPPPLVLDAVASLAPGDVLDVGCGAGGLLATLAERGWTPHGIDIAPRAIEAARAVFGRCGLDATLRVADAASWRPSRTYDLVTCCFAAPNTRADQQRAYAAMRRAVAPGGTVVVLDFDPQMHRLPPFRGFDMVAVADLLEAFDGFEITRAEVVEVPAHDHGQGDDGTGPWTASLLVARRR